MTSTKGRFATALEDAFTDAVVDPGHGSDAPTERTLRLAHLIEEALSEGRENLAALLHGALRETARRTDRVSLAVTGMGWLGAGVPAVGRTMVEMIAGAQQEIILTIYSTTPGSGPVWQELERALVTGIRCTLVINRIEDQHLEIRALLARLVARYPETLSVNNFVADEADGLHAKILVVDRRVALVGSANLTLRGMVGAHELAVILRGPVAELIADRVDMLLRSRLVSRVAGDLDHPWSRP